MSQLAMDTPKVRFFTSATGESIAYASHGSGPFLLIPAWWVSHLELDWQDADFRTFFETLGEQHTVVRYDRPGVGLSERRRSCFELENEAATLAELINHIDAPSCSLLGISCGGPVATLYTHLNPDKVDKLVLVNSFVDGKDIGNDELKQALCALVSACWGLGAKAIIDLFDPDMSADKRKLLGRMHKHSASTEMAVDLLKLTYKMNASDAAKNLTQPALVLHRVKDRTISVMAGRRLAAMIPNSEFKTLEGKAHLPWLGAEADQFLREILGFTLGGARQNRASGNEFRQVGEVWSLSYRDKTVHLKDALGLHDLGQLIGNPGKDIHVRVLANGDATGVLEAAQSKILDSRALEAYRQRLDDMDEAQHQAAQGRDESLYAELEGERDALQHELARALGLSGRQRNFNCTNEKARKAISSRIRTSIARIESVHAELGEHLKQSIRTGNFCRYEPTAPLVWRT